MGCFFTWGNKREGSHFVERKLGRVMGNLGQMEKFNQANVEFLQRAISDHSPALVTVGLEKNFGPKPFKFFNFWTDHEDFLNWVSVGWQKRC